MIKEYKLDVLKTRILSFLSIWTAIAVVLLIMGARSPDNFWIYLGFCVAAAIAVAINVLLRESWGDLLRIDTDRKKLVIESKGTIKHEVEFATIYEIVMKPDLIIFKWKNGNANQGEIIADKGFTKAMWLDLGFTIDEHFGPSGVVVNG